MGKKAREYKSGDFIFAKVKGYPAWPARVQRLNGKKYFVYFYGTGETANLPPNMIFDYAENKDKFLTKTQKRRDFNDGVRQIEHDFANNVPLEEVIGGAVEVPAAADDTANDSANNDTMDETADTTVANDTADDEAINTTQNDAPIEDSDENGALVIDEGKAPKKKPKIEPKTPVATPKTPVATPKPKDAKTPRGKKREAEDEEAQQEKEKEEEIVSRSGRKIRPKRFVDEQTVENSTLPIPAPKKRRAASPPVEKDKPEPKDKNIKSFNAVTQAELEELKQPFKPANADKENILIAYLPSGKYIGIKLFQSRPSSFKNESARLQWDKQAASNAITLRMQLERGQIVAHSVQGQLVMDLNLTKEEKATLDKERETEEKKSRVQFLKTEMKLIEIDAKIKTCLSLEKADTELCLKLMGELHDLDIKPLMLLKHANCIETVKRLRAYVGNAPGWDLSEEAAVAFNKQAHRIRKEADQLYQAFKDLFVTPDGLTFWEYFTERVVKFKAISNTLSAGEILEMVHEPLEMTQPSTHTMQTAIDAANEEDDEPPKRKLATGKSTPKKPATPAKGKRASARNKAELDKNEEPADGEKDSADHATEQEPVAGTSDNDTEAKEADDTAKENDAQATPEKEKPKKGKNARESKKKPAKETEKNAKESEKNAKDSEKNAKESDKNAKDSEKNAKEAEQNAKESDDSAKEAVEEEKSSEDTNEKEDAAENDTVSNDNSEPAPTEEITEQNDKQPVNEAEPEKEINTTPKKNPKKASKEDKSPKIDKAKEPEADSTDKELKSPKKGKDDKEKEEIKDAEKNGKDVEKSAKEEKSPKDTEKSDNDKSKESKEKADDKNEEIAEPRAKRSRETRESKKTEAPPPRSPAKRKSKN